MKKDNAELEDEMRPEYDLRSLTVESIGPRRKSFGSYIVRLEPDVAEMFPNADAVNEALRFLAKITKENPLSLSEKARQNLEAH